MSETTPPSATPKIFAAYIFLGILVSVALLSVLTLATKQDKLKVEDANFHNFVTGKVTAQFENKYGEFLWGRDAVVTPWNSINYALFHTGDKKIIVGNDGWIYFREEVTRQPHEAQEMAHKLEVFQQVRDYLNQRGIALVVALLPSKARIYPEYLPGAAFPAFYQPMYEDFHAKLQGAGIYGPDLLAYFEEQKAKSPMFLKTDTHWTPEGAYKVAEYLAANVQKDCTGLTLQKQNFKTFVKKPEAYDGDLLKFITTGFLRALVGPKGEEITPHVTHLEQAEGAPAGDLFGDAQVGITLVGTSFSFMQHLNFEGALKTAFGTDVLNLATEGKGPMKPMADYLKDTDFTTNPPQLVIWEVPERFLPIEYNDVSFDFLKERLATPPAASVNAAPVCTNPKAEVK